MKISNETKIGLLAAVAIVLLIFGFNFLKGSKLFENNTTLYAVFGKVEGLRTANPVTINGLQVGKVAEIHERDKNLSGIIVSIDLTKEVNIPKNSMVFISKELLGEPNLIIKMGNANAYVVDGDTLVTTTNPGLLENVQQSITPAVNNLNSAIQSLELFITNLNSILDPRTKSNLQDAVANAAASTAAIRNMLNAQTGALAQSLNNMNTFTANLNKNNENINQTMANLENASSKFAKLELDQVINDLKITTKNLKEMSTKINSQDGSIGLLLNDKKLYYNLENSARSLNILLDDLRANPKRYVNISLIGRKNKGGYLEAPLNDTLKRK